MNSKFVRVLVSAVTAHSMVITAPGSLWAQPKDQDGDSATTTPIKHAVVIFQENVSFDHFSGPISTTRFLNTRPTKLVVMHSN